jgi:hypothetical protein
MAETRQELINKLNQEKERARKEQERIRLKQILTEKDALVKKLNTLKAIKFREQTAQQLRSNKLALIERVQRKEDLAFRRRIEEEKRRLKIGISDIESVIAQKRFGTTSIKTHIVKMPVKKKTFFHSKPKIIKRKKSKRG